MTQSLDAGVAMGFEPPSLTQFSVFLPNRVGVMLELVDVFDGQALVLAGFCVMDSADYSVVRLVTSRSELARRLLSRNKMSFSETQVLAVEIGGGKTLAGMCRNLLAAEVNIAYAYPLIVRPRGNAAVVLQSDDITLSGQILRRKLYTLLAENDLGDNASRSAPDNQ